MWLLVSIFFYWYAVITLPVPDTHKQQIPWVQDTRSENL